MLTGKVQDKNTRVRLRALVLLCMQDFVEDTRVSSNIRCSGGYRITKK